MGMSNYLRNKTVDYLLRQQSFSSPATTYIALCTSAPTAAAAGAEVAVAGYTRAPVVSSLANWAGTQGAGTTTVSSGTVGFTTNNVDVVFGTPSADVPSPVSHFMVMDAASGGNMLFFGTIVNGAGAATPRSVAAGDGLTFVAGALKVQLT